MQLLIIFACCLLAAAAFGKEHSDGKQFPETIEESEARREAWIQREIAKRHGLVRSAAEHHPQQSHHWNRNLGHAGSAHTEWGQHRPQHGMQRSGGHHQQPHAGQHHWQRSGSHSHHGQPNRHHAGSTHHGTGERSFGHPQQHHQQRGQGQTHHGQNRHIGQPHRVVA